MPGLRRRRCSARRRYQRGPLKVAQATPWLIDRGDLLAAVQRAVQCPASCNALVIAVPIAPAQAVTTAVRPPEGQRPRRRWPRTTARPAVIVTHFGTRSLGTRRMVVG